MNWYRIGVRDGTKPERFAEVQAHNAGDASMCAMVKLKMLNAVDPKITTFECIETPGWLRAAIEAAEKALKT